MRGIDEPSLRGPGREDPRLPFGFAVGAAFALMLWASAALSGLSARPSAAGLAVMATIAALLGWFSTWPGALVTAALGWLMLDGFVIDRYGVLHWHGRADAVRLAVLAASGLVTTALRAAQLNSDSHRMARRARLGKERDELKGNSTKS